jgi:hypothetical protein
MTVKELREIAFRAIQGDSILNRKWHDCKTEYERECIMTAAVRDYIIDNCVAVIYGRQEPAEQVEEIRRKFQG